VTPTADNPARDVPARQVMSVAVRDGGRLATRDMASVPSRKSASTCR
jgi:hypothetical protein